MNGDFAVIPGNLLLKFREAGGVDPGKKNELAKFRENCLLSRRRQDRVQWSEFDSVCDDVWVCDDIWA